MEKSDKTVTDRESRGSQKLKIMYLMKILMEETDEEHDITLSEIVRKLEAYGISAERKSLYSDMETLRTFGLDIISAQYDRTFHYKLVNREFELAELKLLVDSVQSAKFITAKKSKELIKKIESHASKYEARKLDRQVSVAGRVKAMNERIYYSVDAIHEALSDDRQIEFQYFTWTLDKKTELKHGCKFYHVSPWALCWDDEKYYLIGYDNDDEKIKHFRVDKMLNTAIIEAKRIGKPAFKEISMNDYTNRLFGMFEGEQETVRLLCENGMANIMIDRFGTDIPIIKKDDGHFEIAVKVSVSRNFFGWIMSLPGVKIVSPEHVVKQFKEEIKRLNATYL